MTKTLLRVADLSVSVPVPGGRALAVDRVSFRVARGERVGLVGESGAGKSLTAAALLALLPRGVRFEAGSSILLEGLELVGAPSATLRRVRGGRIGWILQDPSGALHPSRSVGAQLDEVLGLHRGLRRAEARAEAVRLLGEVGIPDPARTIEDPPHRLSGGMRQRVGIALALAGEPDLLVADEPTTALDVTVQARILALLRRVTEERGTGLLLVSHDLGVVAETCHRVVVMYGGRIAESGPVGDVLSRPLHPYTRALLEARPSLVDDRRLPEPIPGEVPTPASWPEGCRFHPRCPRADAQCGAEAPVERALGGHVVRCWHAESPEEGHR
ncbi:MAG: ABC transporter ATP-binding protein [Gemmatimonadetes bacterium]|nr:ABC transporter ATP-binding protein [Gemmatimonadota bacterium]